MKFSICCFYCIKNIKIDFGMKFAYYFVHSFETPINTSRPSASLSGGLFLCPADLSSARNAGTLRANLFGRNIYESLSLWLRP